MAAAGYSRASFDSVRQVERERLRELEALGLEFGRDSDWVRGVWEGGDEPAVVRERLAAEAARQRDRADAIRIDVHPDGPIRSERAAVQLVVEAWGRPDVAATLDVPEGARVAWSGEPRHVLARVAGIQATGGARSVVGLA